MAITQMQASYRVNEDRIFLTLQTDRHESLRFALTRKVCREVLESMDDIFEQHLVFDVSKNKVQVQQSAGKSKKVMQQFAVKTKYPLGKDYVLVTDYALILEEEHLAKVHFSCVDKKEIELQVNLTTFHDLLSLLAQVVEDTDWGLIDVASRNKFIHNSSDSVKFLN